VVLKRSEGLPDPPELAWIWARKPRFAVEGSRSCAEPVIVHHWQPAPDVTLAARTAPGWLSPLTYRPSHCLPRNTATPVQARRVTIA
jgi:hypothetical protein